MERCNTDLEVGRSTSHNAPVSIYRAAADLSVNKPSVYSQKCMKRGKCCIMPPVLINTISKARYFDSYE